MKAKIRWAGAALLAMILTAATTVPAFADAIAPGPIEMLKYRIEEFLPIILIVVGVLAAATAVVLIVVFCARKKKRGEKS